MLAMKFGFKIRILKKNMKLFEVNVFNEVIVLKRVQQLLLQQALELQISAAQSSLRGLQC